MAQHANLACPQCGNPLSSEETEATILHCSHCHKNFFALPLTGADATSDSPAPNAEWRIKASSDMLADREIYVGNIRLGFDWKGVTLMFGQVRMGCWSVVLLAFLLLIPLSFWHWGLPLSLFQFWSLHGSFLDILNASWPIFVWGALLTLSWNWFILRLFFPAVEALLGLRAGSLNNFGNLPVIGILQGTWVALAEEIVYRWLLFYYIALLLNIVNFLLLGFINHGLLLWVYLHICTPAITFLSFGKLSPLFSNPWGWSIGAAALISHGAIRQRLPIANGVWNWLLTWPISLFLFLVMFEYGLLAAILVHVVYEALVVVLAFLISKLPRSHRVAAQVRSRQPILFPLPSLEDMLQQHPDLANSQRPNEDSSETPPPTA